jgi:hypothetical protein
MRADGRCKPRRSLGCHYLAGLDHDDMAIAGLIRARSGANVDDGASGPERVMDSPLETRIRTPCPRIVVTDSVVARHV